MNTMTGPNVLLRLEGLTLFAAAAAAYASLHANGWTFALLLLAPDLAMLAYLIDRPTGALLYNIAHHLALPLLLIAIGVGGGQQGVIELGLIWVAHIGMDRLAGYGFKYRTAFKDTHLQRV